MPKTTISVIKADIGSFPGHSRTHPKLLEKAAKMLKEQEGRLLIDSFVTHCGDDMELIMTHTRGEDDAEIHRLAWKVFIACTAMAKEMKLYGAGQDILSDAFSGNVKGMGPGVAEMEFEERGSDPVLIFMADKTEPGAWNFFLYKIFADPFTTPGLVIDPNMYDGFIFEVHDVIEKRKIRFRTPGGVLQSPRLYRCSLEIRDKGGLAKGWARRRLDEHPAPEPDGRQVRRQGRPGHDRPGTERSPLGRRGDRPVLHPGHCGRLDAGFPPRAVHAGRACRMRTAPGSTARPGCSASGSRSSNGKLIGPADMFDDPAYDRVRNRCNELADVLRAHGPFEPHRLSLDEMEYTTLPGGGKDN